MPSLSEILKLRIGKSTESITYVATKAAVAAHLNVSEKTVENYMNGKRQVKPDILLKLSKFLKFPLSELDQDNEQTVPVLPKKEQTITDKYIQLLEKKERESADLNDVKDMLSAIAAEVEHNRKLLSTLLGEDVREVQIPGLSNKKPDQKIYRKDKKSGTGKPHT